MFLPTELRETSAVFEISPRAKVASSYAFATKSKSNSVRHAALNL